MTGPRAPRIENPGGPVSAYLAKWAPQPTASKALRALDIPCGLGRHTLHLASIGYEVVAIDNDPNQIAQLERRLALQPARAVRTVLGDANSPLPVEINSFDLIVTTHFVSAALIDQLPVVLKVGGLFIYETFGAQGANWLGLPRPGAVRAQLSTSFELLDYRERAVGPTHAEAAVVRAVARLR